MTTLLCNLGLLAWRTAAAHTTAAPFRAGKSRQLARGRGFLIICLGLNVSTLAGLEDRTEQVQTGQVNLDHLSGRFRGYFRGRLRGTFRGNFRGLKTGKINPRRCCHGRSRGPTRRATLGVKVRFRLLCASPMVGQVLKCLVGSKSQPPTTSPLF